MKSFKVTAVISQAAVDRSLEALNRSFDSVFITTTDEVVTFEVQSKSTDAQRKLEAIVFNCGGKIVKHNTVVAHTANGTPVVYADGIWGTGRCLQYHTEFDEVHVSIGDCEGINDFFDLKADDKHTVCLSDAASGFWAWTEVDGRDAAYRTADDMLQQFANGTLKQGKN